MYSGAGGAPQPDWKRDMSEEKYSGSFFGNGAAHGTGIATGIHDLIAINDGELTMRLQESDTGQITGRYSYSAEITVTGTYGFSQTLSGGGKVSGQGSTLNLTGEVGGVISTHGTATINGGTIKVNALFHGTFALLTGRGRAFGTLHGPILTPEAADGSLKLSHAIASMGDGGSAPLSSSQVSNTTDLATTLAPHH
jgi:hypothetical protein